MKKLWILLVALATVFPSIAHAQRTASGGMGIYVSCTHPFESGWGASAGWNRYTLNGIWDASLTATDRGFVTEDAAVVPAGHITVRGGYLLRLCATRDRSLNLYAGGGVLTGAGMYLLQESGDHEPDNDSVGFGSTPYFLYGLYPKAECEYFFTRNVGLSVSFQMPVTIHDGDHVSIQKLSGLCCLEVSAGLKVNF